jgi:hypothetical protein
MTGRVIRPTFAKVTSGVIVRREGVSLIRCNLISGVNRRPSVFVTYENRRNPHVTVHRDGCGQVRKRGGTHKYGQGNYKQHDSLIKAVAYAKSTALPIVNCSYCKPS